MKKEEILEASKKENHNMDIYAIEVNSTGSNIACICMLLLTLFYFTFETFTDKGTNPALYSIITLYDCVLFGYRGIKLKTHKFLNLFNCFIWGLLTIMLVLSYFKVI